MLIVPLLVSVAVAVSPLALYPNPSGDGPLTLVLPAELRGQPLRIRVLDARGAVVAQQQLTAATAEASLQLGRLAKGTYTCEVSAGSARHTVKFVQQ